MRALCCVRLSKNMLKVFESMSVSDDNNRELESH